MIPDENSEDAVEARKELPKLIEDLSLLVQIFKNKTDKVSMIDITKRKYYSYFDQFHFCFSALHQIEDEYYFERAQFYEEQISSLTVILNYLNNTQIAPFRFQIGDYSKEVNDIESTSCDKYLHFLDTMEKYIRTFYYVDPDKQFNTIFERVLSSLNSAQNHVNKSIKYSPFSKFDEYYVEFLNISTYYSKIVEIISSEILSKPKKNGHYDFTPLHKSLVSIMAMVKVRNNLQSIVVNCSFIRYVFETFINLTNNYHSQPETPSSFFAQCYKFQNMTMKELGINPITYPPELGDTKFSDVIHRYQPLLAASNSINSIQYYINPLDISFSLFQALKYIEQFVKEVTSPNIVGKLCNDDFLTYFNALIAYNPPINSIALSQFLSKIEHTMIPDSLNYAIMLFNSSIEFLQISPENIKSDKSSKTLQRNCSNKEFSEFRKNSTIFDQEIEEKENQIDPFERNEIDDILLNLGGSNNTNIDGETGKREVKRKKSKEKSGNKKEKSDKHKHKKKHNKQRKNSGKENLEPEKQVKENANNPEPEKQVKENTDNQDQIEEKPENEKQIEEKPESEKQIEEKPESEKQIEEKPETENQIEEKPETEKQIEEKPESEKQIEEKPETEKQIKENTENPPDIEDNNSI